MITTKTLDKKSAKKEPHTEKYEVQMSASTYFPGQLPAKYFRH